MSREKHKGESERMLKQDEHSERNTKENKTRLSKKANSPITIILLQDY